MVDSVQNVPMRHVLLRVSDEHSEEELDDLVQLLQQVRACTVSGQVTVAM